MAPYQPIGTGYQPIGTGYNRAKGEYGFTGVLEDIKSNNLFKGEFNNRTSGQVNQGVKSGAMPRTGWGRNDSTPVSASPVTGQQQVVSNPAQYLSGSQQSPAAQLLGQPLDAYDQVRDINGDGVVDPWEMMM